MILKIKNKQVDFFNEFTLSLKFDSIASTFGFKFYFDPTNELHKDLIHVGHYHKCTLEHNGELLLTGYLVNQSAVDSSKKDWVTISGYSLPGVLEDCEIPPDIYPLQSDGLTLNEIAKKILDRFKLKYIVDSKIASKMNAKIKESTASDSQKCASYLSELASQRGIVVSHNRNGEVLFYVARTKLKPFMTFGSGIPGVEYKLSFSGQPIHSHITVMKEADDEGGNAGESTIVNPFVVGLYRPTVKVQTSGTDIDTETAARAALSEELKNIKLTISIDRWEDVNGKIIKPNQTIYVENAHVLIPKKSIWFVESVDFTGNSTDQRAVLTCVLPEVYNFETPVNIFEQ